ncbi:MAG: hypothetical protein ACP6IS_00960 [Candidatus Asgardarchaeia archaeon]
MSKWLVTIKGVDLEKAKGITLEMEDVDELVNQQLILTKDYIDDIKRLIREKVHYGTFPNISRVISPDGRDMTNYQFALILGISKDMKRVAVLIAALPKNEYKIMAIWPPDLAEACRDDVSFLKRILLLLSDVPDFWKAVYLLEMI